MELQKPVSVEEILDKLKTGELVITDIVEEGMEKPSENGNIEFDATFNYHYWRE